MQVPAGTATLDLTEVDAGAVVAGGQAHPVDFVAGTLVVDERPWPELADGQEPGPLDVVALTVAGLTLGRDERCQRQSGKRVAGQEPFRGEVAVGVEVTLVDVVGLALE